MRTSWLANLLVQQIAGLDPQLERRGRCEARARVEQRVARHRALGRTEVIVIGEVRGAQLAERARAERLAQRGGEIDRRDVVEIGVVVERAAFRDLRGEIQRTPAPGIAPGLRPRSRARGRCRDCGRRRNRSSSSSARSGRRCGSGRRTPPARNARRGVADAEIELQARLGIEIGIAGDEAAAGRSADSSDPTAPDRGSRARPARSMLKPPKLPTVSATRSPTPAPLPVERSPK